MNPKADFYFEKNDRWQPAIEKLRIIILDCALEEELKWGCPCYTFNKRNIVLIHVFKDYCALLFFKGALLSDRHGLLVQQTKNVQSARQVRFTSEQEVIKKQGVLKTYIYEAIEVEKSGLKVALKKTAEYDVAPEFQKKLKQSAALKKAFYQLTPGRQRGYLLHFSAPKQTNTRDARIEKSIKDIMKGKGLND